MAKLEQEYKKVAGELECQRHNAKAALEAAEMRWKEKEKQQKAEMSQQADMMRDMQRHLEEEEKRHQQERHKVCPLQLFVRSYWPRWKPR